MPRIAMSSSAMIMADWLDALKEAQKNDFKAFEITCVFPSADPQDIKTEAISEAKKLIKESGMEICVHAPFFEINIAAYCRSIREASFRIIQSSIDLCHALGGKTLVVHNGDYTYNLANATRHNHPALEIQWRHNIESLKQINDYANARGITVCLENIAINDTSIDRCYADLVEIREMVGPSLQFTLDMGHSRLSEGIAEGIKVLGDAIGHIHLSDNLGEKDDHLPLGEGNCDYTGCIDFLKNFNHTITLEVINVGRNPAPAIRCRQALMDLLSL